MTRLGVFGGTFDPIHIGHLLLAEAAREQLGLDRVLFVPTGEPWRKAGRKIGPAADRLTMVKLATTDNPDFEVSAIEIEREGPSYTFETLEALANQNPGAGMFFIMGTDTLHDLPNWRSPERIVELATLAVAIRAGSDDQVTAEGLSANIMTIRMPEIGVSASEIRERAAAGQSLRYLVAAAVAEHISAAKLYS
jgi:nicotinate-nucleotide adenylyltransferase